MKQNQHTSWTEVIASFVVLIVVVFTITAFNYAPKGTLQKKADVEYKVPDYVMFSTDEVLVAQSRIVQQAKLGYHLKYMQAFPHTPVGGANLGPVLIVMER